MSSRRVEFFKGVSRTPPLILSSAPVGMLFGALAVENGFTVGHATLMSAGIYAGASQLVGLDLFGQRVAPWVILLSIFAVNFRHILYSASTGRRVRHWPVWQQGLGFFFLTDPQFAETERRGEGGHAISFVWFLGVAIPAYIAWVLWSVVGAMFGTLVADASAFGADFLMPIYFFAMVLGFRAREAWFAIVTSSGIAAILAFELVGSPWHISLGALAGMAVAAAMPVRAREA